METRTFHRSEPIRPGTEDLLTTLINSANHLVWCTSLDGSKLLYANPVAERIYGRPLDELASHQDYWLDAVHPDDRSIVLHNLSELLERGQIEQEYRIVRPDKSIVWLHDRISVVHDKNGKPVYVGGIGTDISAIRESEALYASLVESLPLHVIRKDIDGKVVFGNQRYCDAIGFPLEELIGKTDYDLFPPDLASKYVEDDKRVLETGQVFNQIEEHQNSAGERVFVEIFKGPVRDSQGRVSGVQVMYWDVTERKLAEEEVRAAKELAERANRSKSEFLANMSHEIRTPMNGIIGMTELLFNTSPTADQRSYLNMVKQSAQSLLRLLNDILDFSKIEAGKLDLEQSEFSLRECVGHTVRTLIGRAGEKELDLLCHVDSQLPDVLVGDGGRLGQIVVNLVGNAVKFTEQGEVELSVSGESQSGDSICLHFSVRDTGIGIPQEQQLRIFESFSQVDASTTRRFGGTGLGLAISSQLVELMNGRIWVDSEAGKGTTFHFSGEFCIGSQPPPPVELESIRGLPVLVVDDNQRSGEILSEMLASWGLAPVTTNNGPDAINKMRLAMASGQPIRIAIVDCLMPAMDGFTLIECLRQDNDLTNYEVIMIASSAQADDLDHCRALGVASHMQKPVVQSELLDTILCLSGARKADDGQLATGSQLPTSETTLKVLLAEDGLVNQQVAIGLLEQEGHRVVVANDGQEAVNALAAESFDLILMDVQMPNMDGLTATRTIRQQERCQGDRIPIIAMTAGAMKGDEERCIESGMDAYISKPIDPKLLYETIHRIVASSGRPPADDPSDGNGGAVESTAAIDVTEARHLCRDDDQRLRTFATTLLDESAKLIAEIRAGIESADALSIQRGAHTLKGSAAVFGATRVTDTALRIELAAGDGDLAEIKSLFTDLTEAVSLMTAALDELANTP